MSTMTESRLVELLTEEILACDDISPEMINEIIRKVGKKYRLYSHKGKNLGTFNSKSAAQKHERQVQWFKRKG